MTSISDRWLNATISTLWVGNSELNDTAACPGEGADLQPAGDADRRHALEVRADLQRDIRQRNALGAERLVPGALHGGEERDAVRHHPDPADELQWAGIDGDVHRAGHRDRDVLRVRHQFELGVLEHDAVGDGDVTDRRRPATAR